MGRWILPRREETKPKKKKRPVNWGEMDSSGMGELGVAEWRDWRNRRLWLKSIGAYDLQLDQVQVINVQDVVTEGNC